MVKPAPMLISEFARAADLSPDTVRFYVKRGLLQPEAGRRGGANPYQEFSQADVATARLVRIAQSLGFTLGEIAALIEELRTTGARPGAPHRHPRGAARTNWTRKRPSSTA